MDMNYDQLSFLNPNFFHGCHPLDLRSYFESDLYDSIRQYVVVNARQTPLYSTIRFAGHDYGDFIFVPH
jgi:hypothetical protein